jgi:hypothetical protein
LNDRYPRAWRVMRQMIDYPCMWMTVSLILVWKVDAQYSFQTHAIHGYSFVWHNFKIFIFLFIYFYQASGDNISKFCDVIERKLFCNIVLFKRIFQFFILHKSINILNFEWIFWQENNLIKKNHNGAL